MRKGDFYSTFSQVSCEVNLHIANSFPLCATSNLKEDVFVLSRAWDQNPMRNRTSDLRIPHSNTLPLSHRDSTVSEAYYKVHMTRVLHTDRISNVDSVMFVDRNKTRS